MRYINPRYLLLQIIGRVVSKPTDKAAWNELLHFAPVILAKPKRGGANRNLSNIINRHVASWSSDLQPTVQAHHRHENTRSANKSTEDRKLAAAVTKKLEAGNFKAAIRIICSSDSAWCRRSCTMRSSSLSVKKHRSTAVERSCPSHGQKDTL